MSASMVTIAFALASSTCSDAPTPPTFVSIPVVQSLEPSEGLSPTEAPAAPPPFTPPPLTTSSCITLPNLTSSGSVASEAIVDTASAPLTESIATNDAASGEFAEANASEIPTAITSLDDAIVVQGRTDTPGDPIQAINAASYNLTQDVDEALIAPLAKGYEKAIPKPIRTGLNNVIRNLFEPVNFFNYILQLKPGKALETLGRFAVNSTLGIAGIVDVAQREPFNLPYRHNTFGNTLGYYGVKPGPFLYLPLIGPTTVRDLVGVMVDRMVVPLAIGRPFTEPYVSIPMFVINRLDTRLSKDEEIARVRIESSDPYATTRDNYLMRRQAEIDALRGKTTEPPPSTNEAAPANDNTEEPQINYGDLTQITAPQAYDVQITYDMELHDPNLQKNSM